MADCLHVGDIVRVVPHDPLKLTVNRHIQFEVGGRFRVTELSTNHDILQVESLQWPWGMGAVDRSLVELEEETP